MTRRTNLFSNPSHEANLTGITVSTPGLMPLTRVTTDATAPAGTCVGEVRVSAALPADATVSQPLSGAADPIAFYAGTVRVKPVGRPLRFGFQVSSVASGGAVLTVSDGERVTVPADTWVTLPVALHGPDPTAATIRGSILAFEVDDSRLASGAVFRVDGWMGVKAFAPEDAVAATGPYFDGTTAGTRWVRYTWTGAAHASTSVETSVAVLAQVLPRPVPVMQASLEDLPAGVNWRIVGESGGHTWPLPAGYGTSTGEQVIVVDPRAPLNVPVRYRLVVPGEVTLLSNYVTAALRDADVVLSTLDGATTFVPESLGEGEFPRAVEPQAVQYTVPGRQRGPVRWAAAGLSPGTWKIHCSEERSDDLMALLERGVPLVYRLATRVRDLLPVEFILVTGVTSMSFPDAGSWRTWELEFVYIDDPEPSAVIVADTWDDHDAANAASTWNVWDAEWVDSTWDAWDREDWKARL